MRAGADLDLAAYLARIRYAGGPDPTLANLRALHRAHVAAIPFENLGIVLGRPVPLDLAAIEEKLGRRPRGGYCYEQNLLFAAALDRLGFGVSGLQSRIRMGSAQLRPASHALLLVESWDDPGPWLADVGFGGEGLLEPIALVAGVDVRQGAWRFRLDRPDDRLWVLQSLHPDGWFDLHAFTLDPRYAIDYAVSNHFVASTRTNRRRSWPIASASRSTPAMRKRSSRRRGSGQRRRGRSGPQAFAGSPRHLLIAVDGARMQQPVTEWSQIVRGPV